MENIKERRPGGQPGNSNGRKPARDRADILINMRITAREKKQWFAAAESAGLSLSEWIRRAASREQFAAK